MDLFYIVVALVVVITVHEFSHAWVANYLGDPTARLEGRVSLNPLKHLDPVGTILIFLVRIGWGKPVPVNPSYFKKPRRDEALTALAGPASNLIIALAFAIPIKYFGSTLVQLTIAGEPVLYYLFGAIIDMSIVLFAFNMLPFPPLDGSKFLAWFIPKQYDRAYQNFLKNGTVYFLVFLVFDQFILYRMFGFSILYEFIGAISGIIKSIIVLGA